MPERLIPILDSILMSLFTAFFAIASFSTVTVIGGVLAIIWWSGKIKRDIEKYHQGSICKWLKWFVKKN